MIKILKEKAFNSFEIINIEKSANKDKIIATIEDQEGEEYVAVYDIQLGKIVTTTNFLLIYATYDQILDIQHELNKYASKSEKVVEDIEELVFTDPEEPDQEFDSAGTSLNQIPALFKMNDFMPGDINLDIGGGKYDTATEYLKNRTGSTNLVYDPKNRSSEHNKEVLNIIRENGGADSVTCANVLNVIKEPEVRLAIIRNCYKYLKIGHKAYFITYEDDGKGNEGPTSKGYQLRKKTSFYKNEIEQVFNKVEITKGNKLIIATK